MINIFLQKAKLQDAQIIHSMQLKAFAQLLEKYQDFETNPGNEKIEKIINILNQKESDYLLIKNENTIIGAIRIDMRKSDVYRISPIFILPEYQGKGIGKDCMGQVIERGNASLLPVRLRVLKVNSRAIAFYLRLGFQEIGEVEHHRLFERIPDRSESLTTRENPISKGH